MKLPAILLVITWCVLIALGIDSAGQTAQEEAKVDSSTATDSGAAPDSIARDTKSAVPVTASRSNDAAVAAFVQDEPDNKPAFKLILAIGAGVLIVIAAVVILIIRNKRGSFDLKQHLFLKYQKGRVSPHEPAVQEPGTTRATAEQHPVADQQYGPEFGPNVDPATLHSAVNTLESRADWLQASIERLDGSLQQNSASIQEIDRLLHGPALFDLLRDRYAAECERAISTLFEGGASLQVATPEMREQFASNKELLAQLMSIVQGIHGKLQHLAGMNAVVVASDMEDLERQIERFQRERESIGWQRFHLQPSDSLLHPSFVLYAAYLESDALQSGDKTGGYLGYLVNAYSEYIAGAKGEIAKQLSAIQNAGSRSAQNVNEFKIRSLMNMVDTIDAIVRKGSGKRKLEVIDMELRRLFRLLEVSEIPVEEGELYKAHVHEAIGTETSSYATNAITNILKRGFIDKSGVILRRTTVRIAQ